MKKALLVMIVMTVALLAFAGANNYFTITASDVELHVPRGFPKPYYQFKNNKLTPEKFVLGRKLFYDPTLSKDGTISCGSCHMRIAAFAHIDHALSHGINGAIGKRNVPALQNLIWKDTYMWDGGVNNLEVQPINPITNPAEMNETLEGVVKKLKADSTYVAAFREAFGQPEITSAQVLKALAQFTGLMISATSRYDHYMNGTDTFSAQEKDGLVLFRAKCSSCHPEPLFTDNSYRNNGLTPDTALKDKGRSAITGSVPDEGRFKVPSLRNAAVTYPYMQDGRFRKLGNVLDHYAAPEKFASGADKDVRKIGTLTAQQKQAIVAFLTTLSDKTFIYDRRFIDPSMKQ